MEHHPDKGGDTAIMQQVNTEFEKLYDVWKDRQDVSVSTSGYEHDYSGATAREYTEYVYNEYRWKGRNYKGQHAPEIVELTRIWLKETYLRYRFSVRRENYSGFRGVYQRVRQSSGRNQSLLYRIRRITY